MTQPCHESPDIGRTRPPKINSSAPTGLTRRLWQAFRRFNADNVELLERRALLNRPWEEEFLHWSHDGQQWVLHGHRVPPSGRIRSVTRSGWCPGRTGPDHG